MLSDRMLSDCSLLGLLYLGLYDKLYYVLCMIIICEFHMICFLGGKRYEQEEKRGFWEKVCKAGPHSENNITEKFRKMQREGYKDRGDYNSCTAAWFCRKQVFPVCQ